MKALDELTAKAIQSIDNLKKGAKDSPNDLAKINNLEKIIDLSKTLMTSFAESTSSTKFTVNPKNLINVGKISSFLDEFNKKTKHPAVQNDIQEEVAMILFRFIKGIKQIVNDEKAKPEGDKTRYLSGEKIAILEKNSVITYLWGIASEASKNAREYRQKNSENNSENKKETPQWTNKPKTEHSGRQPEVRNPEGRNKN